MSKIKSKNLILFYRTAIISLIIIGLGLIALNLIEFKQKLFDRYSYSQQVLDQQQLSTYEKGNVSSVNDYYSNTIGVIQNIATSQLINNYLNSSNSVGLVNVFDQQRTFNQGLDTIEATNNQNSLIAVSSDASTSLVNQRSTAAEAKTLNQHQTAILPAFKSGTNRLVVSFIAPVMSSSGQPLGSIIGHASLSTLAHKLNLLADDHTYTNVLVDANGDILSYNNIPSTSLINIRGKEPLLSKLTVSGQTVFSKEINYLGKSVIAAGELIDFNNYGKVYMISFASQQSVASLTTKAKSVFDSYYRIFALINASTIIIFGLLCYYLTKRIWFIKYKPKP